MNAKNIPKAVNKKAALSPVTSMVDKHNIIKNEINIYYIFYQKLKLT